MTPRKLSQRETLSHLDALIERAPVDGKAASATFKLRLQTLRELIANLGHADPTLAVIHAGLLPGLTAASKRTTWSTFRSDLIAAAEAIGHRFALIHPPVRGKTSSQIVLHFEGIPLPTNAGINDTTRSAIAGEARQSRIAAPAAFFSGDTYRRLVELFSDPSNPARLPVRFFLSYAHKDDALTEKLLDRLRDELAISSRFDFRLWQDKNILVGSEWHRDIKSALAECDLCLSLLSPAFFASDYITREEIPPVTGKQVEGVPVMLEPLAFDRHNFHGLDKLQIFSLAENGKTRAFSECRGEMAKRFAHELAADIEARVRQLVQQLVIRFYTDYQSGDPERQAMAEKHPELHEILAGAKSPTRIHRPAAKENATRERLAPLLEACLNHLPPKTIEAYIGTGDLRSLTRELSESGDREDALREGQKLAVDHLRAWVADPDSPPFAAVLGEIGSGKTTTLRMLARTLVRDPAAPPVIFIDLREYVPSGPPSLEAILEEHLRRHDDDKKCTVAELIAAVRNERALIIFDGLDEKIIALGEAERQNFIRELWRILPADLMDRPTESGRGRLIISCRSHYFPTVQAQSSGYLANDRGEVHARDYLACIMLPWRDEQIRAYLAELLGEEQTDRALEIIESVHNLKDLATRPYLLNLIGPELDGLEQDCAAGRSVNAALLYRRFVERWLHRDDGKHVFTPAHKLRLMETLAADLWRDNAREMSWQRVEEWLETFLYENPVIARAVEGRPIAALHQDFRTATFFLRPATAGDSFRFAHTSLQEYFLACHLARALQGGRTAAASPAAAWDLPPPSLETFDFLGQLLQTAAESERPTMLTRLGNLLGEAAAPAAARLNALCYQIRAHRKDLPVPHQPDLALAGLELEGWKINGTAARPLRFGKADFSGASLVRASFEQVSFLSGASFRKADVRGAEFIDCSMSGADFCEAIIEAAPPFFRKCDLREAAFDDDAKGELLLHLCEMPVHWPVPPAPPARPHLLAPKGHAFQVTSVTFSPDSKLFLSGSLDNTLRLWDARSGRCLKTLTEDGSWVTSVIFSPDSKLLLSGSYDNALRLWDARSGKCIKTLTGHERPVTSVAFSPDGKLFLSGSDDHTLRLWEAISGRCIGTLTGHDDGISSAVFSPDGKYLLSSSWDSTLRLFDASSGQCLRVLMGHNEGASSAVFSPDSKLILSGSWDNTLRLWDVSSAQCLRTITGHKRGISSTVFSPDGKLLLSGSWDNILRLWDTRSGQRLGTFTGHEDGVSSTAFSPDGKLVLSGSDDKTLRVWDARSGQSLRLLTGHEIWISSVAFSISRNHFLSKDLSGITRCWTLDGNEVPVSEEGDCWLTTSRPLTGNLSLEIRRPNTTLRLRRNSRILRDIIPLPDGNSLVLEPWDDAEAAKPDHEVRMKLVRGPADAWRYCHAVDPETLAILPPEAATANGAWEITTPPPTGAAQPPCRRNASGRQGPSERSGE